MRTTSTQNFPPAAALLCIVALLLTAPHAAASPGTEATDCTDTTNIVQESFDFSVGVDLNRFDNPALGQSFTAPCTGAVTSVAFLVYLHPITGPIDVALYGGAGNTGPVLATTTFNVTSHGWKTVAFDTPVPVTEGEVYTFVLTVTPGFNTDIVLREAPGSPYPDGVEYNALFGSFSPDPFYDLAFRVHFEPGTPGGCEQTLSATLDDPTPSPGDVVTFAVTVSNDGAAPAPLDLWLDATGPVTRMVRLGSGTVPAGATVTRDVPLRIPGNAPAGTYALDLHVGAFAAGDVCDTVPFTLTVSGAAVPGGAGSGADGAFVSLAPEGDLFAAEAPAAEASASAAMVSVSPNPFTSAARLTLDVPEGQHVRAAVYDALGRQVAVLLDGAIEAGAHGLAFDGSALPAGVYVVRVTGETFSTTRRITLVR